ncbi:guanylate kinase [Methylomagnum ishizawai]|uniref:guanylate kinase n=1 Tax=Methylomagnum ishizawai TaxID=1760988 RepID=UPI001C330B06|nr:guanylate kinase [Methylomagnum ishizawai]BBL73264.1 guanylate kinase [Methylomagnum ishizawai]
MCKGTLFVVSAPSGAGKTSLVKALRKGMDGFTVSVSHTTRAPRPGEKDGRDYRFVERAEFERMIAAGEFLEHARVFDNHYGTARATVEAALEQGGDVLLEIDWQGARQVRTLLPDSVSVFILPPSLAALEQRLTGRGQDDPATIARRMGDAISEMSHYGEYDYLVVNDDFAVALRELRAIVIAHRMRRARQAEKHRGLIADLLKAS